jgi:hypothetical protein
MQRKLLGMISVGFDVTDQQLITYSVVVKYLRKNGNTTERCGVNVVGWSIHTRVYGKTQKLY